MNLTPNFTLEELTFSDVAVRLKLKNEPDQAARVNLKKLAWELQAVRNYFQAPVRILSGYRSPEVNRAVGGSKTSAHPAGLAADFIVERRSPADAAFWVARDWKDMGLHPDQIVLEFGQWIHMGVYGRERHQILTSRQDGSKVVYERGISRPEEEKCSVPG